MSKKAKFNSNNILGYSVTDTVTKLKGVCTGVAEFHFGEPRIGVTPVAMKDGAPQDMIWYDLTRLKVGKLHTQPGMLVVSVELGEQVKDGLTGFKGMATGRYLYLNGCVRIEVTPKELKAGQPVEAAVFDQARITGKNQGPGGPADKITPYATCKR